MLRILVLIFFSLNAFGQGGLILDIVDQNVLNDELLATRYKEVSGSPYLFEDFITGKVEFINSEIVENALLQIDNFANVILLKSDDQVTEYEMKYVKLVEYTDSKSSNKSHMRWIPEISKLGSICPKEGVLMISTQTVEKKISSVQETGYSSSDQQDRFVAKEKFYLSMNEKLIEIKLNKKAILENLGDNGVADYAKSNKLKFTKLEDICEILTFYNKQNKEL